jgi:AbrB family looped-hinge helix DNA binding protein
MEVSTMTSKGQIVVPARLRKRYGIKPGTKIHFIERNHEILFQPVTKEYIRSLCGILKSDSSLTKELLKERARDKKREEEKLVKRGAR